MPPSHAPAPPIPEVNDLIDDYIHRKHGAAEDLLQRGRFGHPGEGSGGPLTPRVTICSDGIEVQRPTPEQWAAQVAWHTYCRTHGYKHDELPDHAPPPAPKPTPVREAVTVVRWNTIRDRYTQAACGQDMLF